MNIDAAFDVVIVGSGPAGVSAAFPLLESGLRVLMVDGGKYAEDKPPFDEFLSWRLNDLRQVNRMIGRDFHALRTHAGDSPKLRIPALSYVFDEFKQKNLIVSDNFTTVGSLATGGLSNAWGCGVARMSAEEMLSFPFNPFELNRSYETIINRIGISGCANDDLADYYGIKHDDGQQPIDLDDLHEYLLIRYNDYASSNELTGFKLGRTRLAVLSSDRGDRSGCVRCSNCLWGCSRKSLYSAVNEIPELKKYSNFKLISGVFVSDLKSKGEEWIVNGVQDVSANNISFTAKRVVLAAGTLATTRLVLKALNYSKAVPLMSCPTAAFMLWVPKFLGVHSKSSFGLGQLSFTLVLNDKKTKAFGATFNTLGLPVSEFLRHIPFRARYGLDILKNMLGSCVVGNMFIPGNYGKSYAKIDSNGHLRVSYHAHDALDSIMKSAKSDLINNYRKIGAFMLPGSFTKGKPGGDIHYSGTFPMRLCPGIAEADPYGEVNGLKGVHLVDGSVLPILPAKPHTLTIMANADRIALKIASMIKVSL